MIEWLTDMYRDIGILGMLGVFSILFLMLAIASNIVAFCIGFFGIDQFFKELFNFKAMKREFLAGYRSLNTSEHQVKPAHPTEEPKSEKVLKTVLWSLAAILLIATAVAFAMVLSA